MTDVGVRCAPGRWPMADLYGLLRLMLLKVRSPSLYPLSYGRYQEFRAAELSFDGLSDGLSLPIRAYPPLAAGPQRTTADGQWRVGFASDGLFVRWSRVRCERTPADGPW